jgi:hypothetical protein
LKRRWVLHSHSFRIPREYPSRHARQVQGDLKKRQERRTGGPPVFERRWTLMGKSLPANPLKPGDYYLRNPISLEKN